MLTIGKYNRIIALEEVKQMKTRPNQEIRDALKLYGLTQWDLCKALELSEMTLYRRLRDELPEDQKQEYMNAIKKLASIN